MSENAAIIIRQATTEDIPELERLIPESVRALSSDYYTKEQIESALVNIFGVDTQLIADGTYYVAELDGRIVGCGGWSKRKTLFGGDQTKEEEDPLIDPSIEPARIRAFFIHPRYARRGLAGRIIETCEQAAREAGFTAIELAATLPGEPLYKAFGYQAIERFDAPLPDGLGLPVARMRKKIKN
ncbi:MAG TPA: GNAT family N-acetyltransferase [Pyrinomonadaceae bacterium]|nr:GNAT family N-acetyltransferase [Pyrinomonadaceae bacterium]